jgi:hypothetical protein
VGISADRLRRCADVFGYRSVWSGLGNPMGKKSVKKLSEPQLWLLDYLRMRYKNTRVEIEYRFNEKRRWRFDASVPVYKIAFEIEGGLYVTGAHVRGQHYESDMEKYNTATVMGWKVFRFTPKQVLNGTAKAFIERYL